MIKKCLLLTSFAISALMAFGDNTRIITPYYYRDSSRPSCSYYAALNFKMGHVFEKSISCSQGENLCLKVVGTIPCYVYFFKEDTPDTYSQSFKTILESNIVNLYSKEQYYTVPSSGNYFILVTAAVNDLFNHSVITIVKDTAYTQKVSENSLSFTHTANQEMCAFTTCSSHDTRLYAIHGQDPGTVIAYNDDNTATSGINWGTESRIITTPSASVNRFIITSHNEDADPEAASIDSTDFYKGSLANSVFVSNLDSLYREDAFLSDYNNQNMWGYNDLAWALGIWTTWIWPLDDYPFISHSEEIEVMEDYLYSCGYTWQGVNNANVAIDMWMVEDFQNYDCWVSQFTAKAKSNPYALGYGWESKVGGRRVFHPRNGLCGDSYGTLNEPFRKMASQATGTGSNLMTSLPIIENSSFTKEETDYIKENKKGLVSAVEKLFEELYGKAENAFMQSGRSNVKFISRTDSYQNLLRLCQDNPNLLYAVFEKVGKGCIIAPKLMVDLTYTENADVMKKTVEDRPDNSSRCDGNTVFRSLQAEATLYAKALLYKERRGTLDGFTAQGCDKSNNPDAFSVEISGNRIFVNFRLEHEAIVTALLANTSGMVADRISPTTALTEGLHTLSLTAPHTGVFVVSYIVDGKVYNKQVNIK